MKRTRQETLNLSTARHDPTVQSYARDTQSVKGVYARDMGLRNRQAVYPHFSINYYRVSRVACIGGQGLVL